MHTREPGIRHKPGRGYFVRWGGKDHYLSKDFSTAQKLFFEADSPHPAARTRWHAWSMARRSGTLGPAHAATPHAHAPPPAPALPAPPRPSRPSLSVVRIAAMLDEHYLTIGRPDTAKYFRYHLRRFLHVHGLADLVAMTSPSPRLGRYAAPIVSALQALAEDLSRAGPTESDPSIPRLSPKTINHDLTACMRLFNFAAERGLCPAVNWKGLRKLPTRRGVPEPLSLERLHDLFSAVARTDARCLPYMAVCYLACARPTEALRVISRQGEFESLPAAPGQPRVERALFRPHAHKQSWRAGAAGDSYGRTIIITDELLRWLDVASPHPSSFRGYWSRLDSFSSACVRAGLAGGPHILRDSSASHLRDLGMPLEDVRTCLGHVPTGEWRSYARVPWRPLRAALSQLTLRGALDR